MAGVHAAVGVRLLARNGMGRGAGFIAPELYFDPSEYLHEIEAIPGVTLTWDETALPAERRTRTMQHHN
jgi:hypothetical protein